MGGSEVNLLTPALQCLTKYKPPHCMGGLSRAVMEVATHLTPDRLEKVKPDDKKEEKKKTKKRKVS